MEERFRDELKQYVRHPQSHRITPAEIPPLITVTGNLPPTSKNKMFNAILTTKNFGGQRSMLTLAPTTNTAMESNVDSTASLLRASKMVGTLFLGGSTSENKAVKFSAIANEASTEQLVAFLSNYKWLETDFPFPRRPPDVRLQVEFLEKQKHDIVSWLILAPQRKVSYGKPLAFADVGEFAVKERHRVEGRGFQVYGEPDHRLVAEFLSDIEPGNGKLTDPNADTKSLRDKHRGVMLLYPVREEQEGEISIGYELLFPKNDLPFDLHFSVREKGGTLTVDMPIAGNP